MDAFTPSDKFLFIGTSGCGKSYLAKKLQYPRCVIFDTLHEYDQEEHITYNFTDFCDRLLFFEREHKTEFRLVYQFDPESSISDHEFNHAMRVLYYHGDLQIVIEEVQNFSSVHSMPHWLKQSFLTGRHQNISLQMTTQRPGELNKLLLSQCKHVFFGQIFEKNDTDYCRSVLGDRAFELANLKQREFLYFSPGKPVEKMTNDLKRLSPGPNPSQDKNGPDPKINVETFTNSTDHEVDIDPVNITESDENLELGE